MLGGFSLLFLIFCSWDYIENPIGQVPHQDFSEMTFFKNQYTKATAPAKELKALRCVYH